MGKELELAIKIGGKVDKSLGAAINNAQSQLNKIAKVGNMVGAGITTAVVTAGAALIAESTKQAISYEKAMAGVAKVVDDCRDANGNLTETYHELYNGILDMSTEIPMTANDISSIVESAGQAGIAKDELLDFAESAAKMGIAFDTTAEQAGDWMAQWRTSMGLTQTEVETLADQINYLGNTSSEKATKLSEVVSRVGALGKIAGLSGGQVAAIAAAMPGVEAEVAATGIKNMTKAMTKGEAVTKKQQAVLDKLGFSATELANRMQTDAQGAILDLLGSIKRLPEAEQSAALSQYFGNESVSAIAPLLSNLDNLQELFGKVGDSSKYAGSMQTEYDAAAATTANKIELLKNKISKEMIELGNQITPVLSESIDKISDKIPELADIIGRAIEKIIPIATSAFEFLVDNSDKIISGAIGIAKAFVGFKAIKEADSIVKFISSLSKIKEARNSATILEGIVKTLTGLSTGGIAVGVVTGITAGIVALSKAAYNAYVHSKEIGTSLNPIGENLTGHMESLQKITDLRKEFGDLELVIKSNESSNEEVTAAQTRIEEIRNLLSEEYNLNIDCNTDEVNKALNLLNEKEYMETKGNTGTMLVGLETGAAEYAEQMQYIKDTENAINATQSYINSGMEKYYKAVADGDTEAAEKYLANANAWENRVEDLQNDKWYSKYQEETQAYNSNAQKAVEGNYATAQYELLNGKDATQSLTGLQQALQYAGTSGYEYAKGLAVAQSGYTEFSDAVANSKAAEMAQNFLNYSTSLGETSEAAVQGAALIANGFENVSQVSKEAIPAVIADMKSLGDVQGIFNGLDSSGITDKLTDMAHAMNLIPENKSISIDANGNFEIIAEAENQIASLRSQGNVNVSVNANGDFSILNTVTGEIQTLQGMGATNLQVNANGNIDVLNKAQEVIATIDSKSAQINIDGQAYGLDQIQQAKQTAEGLHDKSVTASVVGSFNGQDIIAKAVDYQSKLNDVSRSQTITGKFPGKSNVATALSYQSRLHDKNVTYTVTYTQKGTPPANNAAGTSNWHGGLTYVNDQKISDPREVIEHNGMRYWYEGKNVLANIPRGARIYNAAASRQFIDGSHKNGLERVPFDGYIAELHEGERVLTSTEANAYNNIVNNSSMGLDELEKAVFGVRTFPAEFQSDHLLTADDAGDYDGGTFDAMLERLKEMIDDMRGDKLQNDGDSGNNGTVINFSPNITINGNSDEGTVISAMRISAREFKKMYEEMIRDERRKSF